MQALDPSGSPSLPALTLPGWAASILLGPLRARLTPIDLHATCQLKP
jgi:hypothetical protein